MTYVQQWTAIADGLKGSTVGNQVKLDVADAFVRHFRSTVIDLGKDPDNLTNEDKAHLVVYMLTRFVRDVRKAGDAGILSARSDVDTAESTAESTATSEWGDPAAP